MSITNQAPDSNKIFDTPRRRPNPMKRLKKIRDTVMGMLYILVAVALIWAEKNGYTTFGINFTYALGGVFIIYGLFRIYRALIQKG